MIIINIPTPITTENKSDLFRVAWIIYKLRQRRNDPKTFAACLKDCWQQYNRNQLTNHKTNQPC